MSVQKADDELLYYCYLPAKVGFKSINLILNVPKQKKNGYFLNMVVQNATLNGTIVDYDLKKPFDTVLVSANSQSWLTIWYVRPIECTF